MAEEPQLPGIPESPEIVKIIQWVLGRIHANWGMVKQAPEAFVILAVIAAIVGYFVAFARFSDRLTTADDRVKLATEQATAYKDKLQGASPDEAAKLLATLQTEVDDLKNRVGRWGATGEKPQRHLEDDTKAKILAAINASAYKFGPLVIFTSPDRESASFAGEFWRFFNSDDFKNTKLYNPRTVTVPCVWEDYGLLAGLSNIDHPSHEAMEFTKILHDAGLEVQNTRWGQVDPFPVDYDLYICQQK